MPGNTIPLPIPPASAFVASMRPQRNAGEYDNLMALARNSLSCFNEAPAKCRGILRFALHQPVIRAELQ